jgi:hypothetical protein
MANNSNGTIVNTAIGSESIDNKGAALAVAHLDVAKSYQGVDLLLQKSIRDKDLEAWETIKAKINYTYQNLDVALTALEKETGFLKTIKARLTKGQKILFKPNLVAIENISPYNFGPLPASNANTEWAFVAAVMRWFHDKAGISYYQMSIGEAATAMACVAADYSHIKDGDRPVTTEAAIEGKSDDFYGGWGFYFVRTYLAQASDAALGDDPMRGLEESMAGTHLPPGEVDDKLMVYDLNRISDDPSKGRDIPVPDGDNFTTLTLHKAIVGGDPADAKDRKRYPGAILINLPRLKVHAQALFTNAVKNLGIGLYPMEVSDSKTCDWKYATPQSPVPGIKAAIPHQVWVPEVDPATCLPLRDTEGNYIVNKTGGLTATMLEIIKAVEKQDIFMLHIVDGIEAINRDHQGIGLGIKTPEGLMVAGLDPLATDLLCARYMFSNVGLAEAKESGLDDGLGGSFPQKVPVPHFDGTAIVTQKGYDSPISRDACFTQAKKAGLGKLAYYVVGKDDISGSPLASFMGRLGFVKDDTFSEIVTKTLFSDIYKMPWDLQKTYFGYLEAVDKLEKTSFKNEFLEAFDETGDGRVTYEEYGKKGIYGPTMLLGGLHMTTKAVADESESFRTLFTMFSTSLRCTRPDWNPDQHHFNRERNLGAVAVVAQMMSQYPKEMKDPFAPGLTWGQGKWPSYSLAANTYVNQTLYGWKYPSKIGFACLYGSAVAFADYTQNDRKLFGSVRGAPDPNGAQAYIEAIAKNQVQPFDFSFYVPEGFGGHGKIPNVIETSDPAKILTAEFDQGKIKWPDARLAVL